MNGPGIQSVPKNEENSRDSGRGSTSPSYRDRRLNDCSDNSTAEETFLPLSISYDE
jgi:hypothetical protein